MQHITVKEVSEHKAKDSAWIIVEGSVCVLPLRSLSRTKLTCTVFCSYDMTDFL